MTATSMFKLVVLVRRADGVSHDALVTHWRDRHMSTVAEYIRPDRYSVTFFDAADDVPYDGMASFWFHDTDRGRNLVASDGTRAQALAVKGIPDDGFAALTRPPHVLLACEEHVIVPGPQPDDALKVTGLVGRKPDVDRDLFYSSWLADHVPNVGGALQSTLGGLRYVVTQATQGEADPVHAGFAEVYYTDADAARAHMSKLGADNFLQYTCDSAFLYGHEVVGIE